MMRCCVQVGEDPFTALRQETRKRVKAQRQRQVANVRASSKDKGGPVALPPTLKLAAALPSHGKGKPSKRQEMQDDVRTPCLVYSKWTAFQSFVSSSLAAAVPLQGQPKPSKRQQMILESPHQQQKCLPCQIPSISRLYRYRNITYVPAET